MELYCFRFLKPGVSIVSKEFDLSSPVAPHSEGKASEGLIRARRARAEDKGDDEDEEEAKITRRTTTR